VNPHIHLKIICKEACCIINQQLMWCDMYLRMYIHHITIMNVFGFRLLVLNATFNNISVISWRSVLLAEETKVPWENHRLAASQWQTLSHNVVSSTPLHAYTGIYIYIYVWKLNQTVLELDFWAVNFLFFPRRDLNSHHWYTAAPLYMWLDYFLIVQVQ
jgi:hypothetical protein